MHQAGIDTAVCACGTALTPDQVKLISQYADEVILSYDSDEAGQKATLRSLELFRNSPVRVGVLQIPGAKDPDEYIKKYGADRFKALLDGVGNALDFRLGRLRSQYDLKQDAQRLEYVKEAVEMLAQRSNPTEQEVEVSLATLRAFVSEEALNELSRLAAQYSDVNCTPEDIKLYLERIARGTPVASRAASMSTNDIEQYLQSMREQKQGTADAEDSV